jgi:hypothetical protein
MKSTILIAAAALGLAACSPYAADNAVVGGAVGCGIGFVAGPVGCGVGAAAGAGLGLASTPPSPAYGAYYQPPPIYSYPAPAYAPQPPVAEYPPPAYPQPSYAPPPPSPPPGVPLSEVYP